MKPLLNPLVPAAPRAGDSPEWRWLFAEARNERTKIESRYDEAANFALPGREGFNKTADDGKAYDDTAIQHTPEFASNIQAGIMPNFSRWASHIAGVLVEDEEKKKELRVALDKIDAYIFAMINSSNAPTEINEGLIDLALGTGLLRVDAGLGLHPINCRAVAQRNFFFTVGVDGQPDAVFEERMLTISEMEVDYPDLKLPEGLEDEQQDDEAPRKYRILEAWRRDWTEPAAMRKKMAVLFPANEWFVGFEDEMEGSGCSPYVGPFRWSKASGEAWGRGPLFNILPSLRTVNFAMSALLEHSDFALAGIWNIEDDGVINTDTVRLEPGAVVPKAPGSQGLTNVLPGGRFDMQQFMIDEMRKNIKRALYADQLGDPERSPKTATEISQRMAALARAIGSSFGRLIAELAIPFVERVAYVLKEQGLIKLPQVDGKTIALFPSSPLAQAQRFEDVDAFDRFTGLIQARYGEEAVSMFTEVGEAVPWLAERFGVPGQVLKSVDRQKETMDTMEEALGGQDALGGVEGPLDAATGLPGETATAPGF